MVATPYKNVTFSTGETASKEKFNQAMNNQQWLFENMPKAVYSAGSIKRQAGIKILSGKAVYAPSPLDWLHVEVGFGNVFSPGCQPVVVCTVASGWSHRKYATIAGLGGTGEFIDHRGFIAVVCSYEGLYRGNSKWSVHDVGGHLNWMAIGY